MFKLFSCTAVSELADKMTDLKEKARKEGSEINDEYKQDQKLQMEWSVRRSSLWLSADINAPIAGLNQATLPKPMKSSKRIVSCELSEGQVRS